MIELSGKVALVTGASRGIGRAIALGYAEAGADIAVLARGADGIEETAAAVEKLGRRVARLTCDVEDPSQIEHSVERATAELGPLDIVVNNAGGITCGGPFLQLTPAQWRQEIRLNLESVLHVCQSVGEAMVTRRQGSIINIASLAGEAGMPNYAPYAMAKAAVTALTHSLAAEWGASGVRVNAITPGWMHTELTHGLATNQQLSESLLKAVPVGRFGRPDELVGLAVYLASDTSRFMTGSSVVIDGGITSYHGGSAMLQTARAPA